MKLLTLRAKRGVGLIGEDTNARPTRPVTYAEISSGTEVGRTKPSCPDLSKMSKVTKESHMTLEAKPKAGTRA